MVKTTATTTSQARQVALDDVLTALRGRCVAKASEAGVSPRVHEDEHDHEDRDENVKGCNDSEHGVGIARTL